MGRSQPVRADDFVAVVVRLFEPCGPQPPAAEARKRAPQAAPDIPYEVNCINIRSKTIVRTLRRIPHSDCSFTPATGYRADESGVLANVGAHGNFISSSAFSATSAHAAGLHFQFDRAYPFPDLRRTAGRSVRCVQHLSKLLLVPIRTAPKQPGWAAFPALNLQSTEPPPTQ